ncbi:unnamed protein product [Amoebophrya sp. A120]|nr:unnamed protein product [Amoebophrya sp. A120]|eukprot:GSA120T00019110001.1
MQKMVAAVEKGKASVGMVQPPPPATKRSKSSSRKPSPVGLDAADKKAVQPRPTTTTNTNPPMFMFPPLQIPSGLTCPISGLLMIDPVMVRPTGHVYEYENIKQYVLANQKDFISGEPLYLDDEGELECKKIPWIKETISSWKRRPSYRVEDRPNQKNLKVMQVMRCLEYHLIQLNKLQLKEELSKHPVTSSSASTSAKVGLGDEFLKKLEGFLEKMESQQQARIQSTNEVVSRNRKKLAAAQAQAQQGGTGPASSRGGPMQFDTISTTGAGKSRLDPLNATSDQIVLPDVDPALAFMQDALSQAGDDVKSQYNDRGSPRTTATGTMTTMGPPRKIQKTASYAKKRAAAAGAGAILPVESSTKTKSHINTVPGGPGSTIAASRSSSKKLRETTTGGAQSTISGTIMTPREHHELQQAIPLQPPRLASPQQQVFSTQQGAQPPGLLSAVAPPQPTPQQFQFWLQGNNRAPPRNQEEYDEMYNECAQDLQQSILRNFQQQQQQQQQQMEQALRYQQFQLQQQQFQLQQQMQMSARGPRPSAEHRVAPASSSSAEEDRAAASRMVSKKPAPRPKGKAATAVPKPPVALTARQRSAALKAGTLVEEPVQKYQQQPAPPKMLYQPVAQVEVDMPRSSTAPTFPAPPLPPNRPAIVPALQLGEQQASSAAGASPPAGHTVQSESPLDQPQPQRTLQVEDANPPQASPLVVAAKPVAVASKPKPKQQPVKLTRRQAAMLNLDTTASTSAGQEQLEAPPTSARFMPPPSRPPPARAGPLSTGGAAKQAELSQNKPTPVLAKAVAAAAEKLQNPPVATLQLEGGAMFQKPSVGYAYKMSPILEGEDERSMSSEVRAQSKESAVAPVAPSDGSATGRGSAPDRTVSAAAPSDRKMKMQPKQRPLQLNARAARPQRAAAKVATELSTRILLTEESSRRVTTTEDEKTGQLSSPSGGAAKNPQVSAAVLPQNRFPFQPNTRGGEMNVVLPPGAAPPETSSIMPPSFLVPGGHLQPGSSSSSSSARPPGAAPPPPPTSKRNQSPSPEKKKRRKESEMLLSELDEVLKDDGLHELLQRGEVAPIEEEKGTAAEQDAKKSSTDESSNPEGGNDKKRGTTSHRREEKSNIAEKDFNAKLCVPLTIKIPNLIFKVQGIVRYPKLNGVYHFDESRKTEVSPFFRNNNSSGVFFLMCIGQNWAATFSETKYLDLRSPEKCARNDFHPLVANPRGGSFIEGNHDDHPGGDAAAWADQYANENIRVEYCDKTVHPWEFRPILWAPHL